MTAHDPREPDDGIERRSQLVAHIGEEGALGGISVLSGERLANLLTGQLD
ncbi:MAG: hypothetical protein M3Q71_20550 [Chloroflexota bacterium]|nr:hypothetical protein [Chloroflexota bacterium]